jgi:hypothetical protein
MPLLFGAEGTRAPPGNGRARKRRVICRRTALVRRVLSHPMMRRAAGLACLALWAGCQDHTVDAEVHADGPGGGWDLYPAKCIADQTGAAAIEMPGGAAVPNVRVQRDGSGTVLGVHGPPPSVPVVFHPESCSVFDVDLNVDKHGPDSSPYWTVSGHVTFDCASPDTHVRGSATFENCE